MDGNRLHLYSIVIFCLSGQRALQLAIQSPQMVAEQPCNALAWKSGAILGFRQYMLELCTQIACTVFCLQNPGGSKV